MTEALRSLKSFLVNQREASLGTWEGESPFVSAVHYLFEPTPNEEFGSLYLFLSQLARHTKNIERQRKASLLVVENKPEVSLLERKRLTVLGEMEPVESEKEKERLREAYQKKFPEMKRLLTLSDFRFYRLRPREIHWIGGFGQIHNFSLPE